MSVGSRPDTSFSQQSMTREADYLVEHVGDALKFGLSAIQTYKPKDPIDFLARCLYKYYENVQYQKQVKIDAENLEKEILQYNEDIRLAKEMEEERRKIQLEEDEKRILREQEEQIKKEQEMKLKREEEAQLKAQQEEKEAAEALKAQNIEETDANELPSTEFEEGKLLPVEETDEIENSTRDPTKILGEIDEENTAFENSDINNEDVQNAVEKNVSDDIDE